MDNDIILLATMIVSIIIIVFVPETKIEKKIQKKWYISREWWIPLLAFGFVYSLGIIPNDIIVSVFNDKIGIILLIFAFSLLSFGLGKSNYFNFVAYKIALKSGG